MWASSSEEGEARANSAGSRPRGIHVFSNAGLRRAKKKSPKSDPR